MAVRLNGVNIIENHVIMMEIHSPLIFPDTTAYTCTLTAHASAHTWSSWAEIVDSNASSLSTPFASDDGHITAMVTHEAGQDDTDYMVQIAHGASKVPISSWRINSATKKVTSTGQSRIRGVHIPAGETIYARVMCETAGSKTLEVHFRYFLES